MTVSQTSLQAYEGIKDKLGDRQQEVYEALRDMVAGTNDQIADHLGWPINRVTGRVSELHKFGLVEIHGIGKSKFGNSAKVWTTCDLNDSNLERIANECAD